MDIKIDFSGPVVVTGVSGFIGQALLQEIDAAGIDHIGLTRSRPREATAIRQVSDYGTFTPPHDAVLVHLAECSSQTAASAGPQVAAVTALLHRLLRHDWKHVVYASSVAVYGDRDPHAHTPEDPGRPQSAYARGKLACEAMVLSAGGSIARLSNAYGAGMAPNNVLSTILDQLDSKEPIRLRRLAPQRDFTHVSDCASALAAMAARQPKGIMNVASGRAVSVAELAVLVAEAAGQQGRGIIATEPVDEFSVLCVDISKTICSLGWRPRVELERGVAELVALRNG